MLKTLKACAVIAWHDEERMLRLGIWVLMPVAALVVFSFGLFFVAMSRYSLFVIAWVFIGLLCISRAGVLRLMKLI